MSGPRADAFADLLGIGVERRGAGHTVAALDHGRAARQPARDGARRRLLRGGRRRGRRGGQRRRELRHHLVGPRRVPAAGRARRRALRRGDARGVDRVGRTSSRGPCAGASRATCWPGCGRGARGGPAPAEPGAGSTACTDAKDPARGSLVGEDPADGRICGNQVIDATAPVTAQWEPCSSATWSSSPSRASSRSMPWARTRSSPARARRPPSLGRAGGYRVTLASRGRWHRPGRERPRAGHRTAAGAVGPHRHPRPARRAAVPSRRRNDEALLAWIRRTRAALSAGGHGVLGRVPRRRSRAPRRAAGSPPTGPGPGSSPRPTPGLTVDPDPIYIRDGKYWSSAGVTAGIDLALALVQEDLGVEVAQTVARWLVMFLHRPGGQTPVRLAGVGPARRALDRPGRADPRRGGAGRRPPSARPGRGRRHERPALHPGLHRRGRRDPEPLRRAQPPGGRPPRARGDERHARRRRGALRARHAPRPCGASSSATSAWRPTPTGGASAPSRTKGHPHDRPPAGRHPALPEVHRARRRRPLRGPPAHPVHRHRLRRPLPRARSAARTACSA